MTDKQIKLVLGALLHDIGKVLYRTGDGRNHSESGYDFLKNDVKIDAEEILNAVRYHHGNALARAGLNKDDIAYIAYIADNISSAGDRRASADGTPGFAKNAPLESVFNLLNNNKQRQFYLPQTLDNKNDINYPQSERKQFDSSFYSEVKDRLRDTLRPIDFGNPKYINSVLEVTEALWTYVPSSTSTEEVADISLFDHSKLTAAYSSCIYDYLEAKGITDYKNTLFDNAKDFYNEKAFLMYSIDISGIQSFIYTITTDKALKTLRARSFYLEIFMESILDELLERCRLSRANIIYCGGGHCYLLMPNTDSIKKTINDFEQEINHWLLINFRNSLYIAGGYTECSAYQLQDKPQGSYAEIFSNMSKIISDKKMKRYSPADIIWLNKIDNTNGLRECKVCKSLGEIVDDRCSFCASLLKFSEQIMDENTKFFTVMEGSGAGVKLPFNRYLTADNADSLRDKMKNSPEYFCSYGKNEMYIGDDVATKLWVGSYHTDDRTDVLAKASNNGEGIERIGVLRLDVDNLGYAFVHGFERENEGKRYVTLSRTATLSRQLSLFFKKHINYILSNPSFHLDYKTDKRNAVVVYAGGDDVFVIGAWDDIIGFGIDLKNHLSKYTEGTLTVSGGIGIYDSGFPISVSAVQVEELESASKSYCKPTNSDKSNPDKNAITVFEAGQSYGWDEFESEVIGEKLRALQKFFGGTKEYGKNFLYNLLNYLRSTEEKINLARYVYLLARMEPKTDDAILKEKYKEFADKMYKWNQNKHDRHQLISAIYLYAYLTRNKGKDDK